MNYVDLQVRPPQKTSERYKAQRSFSIRMESQVSLRVMRKEISIRFFQLKVSEFLTTRPAGHVDS